MKHFYIILLIINTLVKYGYCERNTSNALACSENSEICDCQLSNEYLIVDCSGKGLPKIPEFEKHLIPMIKMLDLSNNHLREFPSNLSNFLALETLDISDNYISGMTKGALTGCTALRFLYLNRNNITNWIDIHPNEVLQPAVNLHTLSVSGNPITSFTSVDETFVLTSNSLKLLDISNCKIQKVTGTHVLQGLLNLEHLILSGNPLRSVIDLRSATLKSLDLSNCKLQQLQPTIFSELSSLTYVTLARNQRLSLLRNDDEMVHSESLKRIDLASCNMDNIELDGFPNLLTAILSHNLINRLKRESFQRNVLLENLDLSYNSINKISSSSFRELNSLKNLDLSFNMIRRIESETFKFNGQLVSINLSRNFIDRLNRFTANSLIHLNVSWCEIQEIDLDAFHDMPELIELDLANNLITDFPVSLQSETLQTLDLSTCRLTSIRNATFRGFPELSRLNLAGNRFTTTFLSDFFEENNYLRDIWLGDNPWRCDCDTNGFFDLYNYLTEHPARLNDRSHIRCHSPEVVYGLSWESACAAIWFPDITRAMGTAEKVWTILMLSILVMVGSICLILSIRKCVNGRKLTRREEERMRNIEESRDIMRQNHVMLEQEAQLNAPDPRESRPPCYEDALKLPRLDGSFASLNELSFKRNRRRRKTLTSRNEDEHDDDADSTDTGDQNAIRRNRSRSEEVLSVRETVNLRNTTARHERASQIESHRLTIVPAVIEIPPRSTLNATNHTNNLNEQHYHVTDILQLHHRPVPNPSITSSQRSQRTTTNDNHQNNSQNNNGIQRHSGSIENRVFDTNEHSPYAQRRSKQSTSLQNTGTALPSGSNVQVHGEELHMIEDHYGGGSTKDRHKYQRDSSDSNDSDSISISDFSTISSENIRQLK